MWSWSFFFHRLDIFNCPPPPQWFVLIPIIILVWTKTGKGFLSVCATKGEILPQQENQTQILFYFSCYYNSFFIHRFTVHQSWSGVWLSDPWDIFIATSVSFLDRFKWIRFSLWPMGTISQSPWLEFLTFRLSCTRIPNFSFTFYFIFYFICV